MGQFNSGYRRPDFSGSQNFGVPSNSSLAPVPASQPKSKTKLLIIVAAAGILLIGLFALLGALRTSNNREWEDIDVYNSLGVLADQIEDLDNFWEEYIGYDFSVIKEDYFVHSYFYLDDLEETYNDFRTAYENIKKIDDGEKYLDISLNNRIENLNVELEYVSETVSSDIAVLKNLKQAFEPKDKEGFNDKCSLDNQEYDYLIQIHDAQAKSILMEYKKSKCELEKIDVHTNPSLYAKILQDTFTQEIKFNDIFTSDLKPLEDNMDAIKEEIEELREDIYEKID